MASARTIQIISFGHPLSEKCKVHLKQLHPDVEFKCWYKNIHLEKYAGAAIVVAAAFESLSKDENGPNVSGGVPTWILLPSAGIAAAAIIATWVGMTGQLPAILNLIRRGAQGTDYVPSPELPVLFLEPIKKKVREARDQLIAPQGVVTF